MENHRNLPEIRYYSGYLRNWRDLCRQLGLEEGLPRQERESAILRAAYARWGQDMPDRLCGAFAFALWDEDRHLLFAARDQVGQKQLFYAPVGDRLLVDGDLNAIAAAPGFSPKLNRRALENYLFYGYPMGRETLYQGAWKLQPGHTLFWDGKQAAVARYWRPVFEPDFTRSTEDWVEEIRNVVTTLMNEERDDPALPHKESFLSGGVDSSYLLAAGDAAAANTVGYEEPGFDESEQARQTAALLGREFRVKPISPQEYFARIPQVMAGMGQPLGDASAVAFSLGCAAAAEHTNLVFSGEGVDEFYGGYNSHRAPLREGLPYIGCSHIMNQQLVRALLPDCSPDFDPIALARPVWEETEGMEVLSRKMAVDITLWLDGDIYLNTDRTSVACGVELHTPFSDRRFFDVARRIPAAEKLGENQNKVVFRKAASALLPEEIAFRKKVGFPVPIRKWMADPRFAPAIEGVLFGEISQALFTQETLRDLWDRYRGGEDLLWNRIYAVYVLLLWLELKRPNF